MDRHILRSVSILGLALCLPLGSAVADDACAGSTAAKRLTRLGGPNAFVPEGVETLADLQAAFVEHRQEIEYLLETQGLVDAIPAVLAAVAEGRVQERDLEQGETFEWMAFRWRGKPKLTDGLCVDTEESYGAFIIEVPVGPAPPAAECALVAEPSCVFRSTTVSLDASGSSPGVSVTGQGQTLIADVAGGATWSGELPDPYRNVYSYTAAVDQGPAQSVEVLRFVVPKVCMNFAFLGSETVEMRGPGCSTSAEVSCPVTTPSCAIAPASDRVWTRQDLVVDVTGEWPADDLIEVEAVTMAGEALASPTFGAPFPNTVRFARPGEVQLVGTATNEIGETADCSATVTVESRWSLRPEFEKHKVDDDVDRRTAAGGFAFGSQPSTTPGPGTEERGALHFDGGWGVGLGLEYRLNSRVGLEGRIGYSRFEGMFVFDSNTEWLMDEADVDALELTFGPDFHLTPDHRFDLILTPFVGFHSFSDGDFRLGGEPGTLSLGFDDQFMWGARLGVDVPFTSNSPWNLSVNARYRSLEADAGSFGVDLDPLSVGVGVTYDF